MIICKIVFKTFGINSRIMLLIITVLSVIVAFIHLYWIPKETFMRYDLDKAGNLNICFRKP